MGLGVTGFPQNIKHTHAFFQMGDRTLCNREFIPPALKAIPSSSLGVGESVLSVYVPGNEIATWTDK